MIRIAVGQARGRHLGIRRHLADVYLSRRYLACRPDRQLQNLAKRRQVCITRTTVISFPEIDARLTYPDLLRHLSASQSTLDASFAKILGQAGLAWHCENPSGLRTPEHRDHGGRRQEPVINRTEKKPAMRRSRSNTTLNAELGNSEAMRVYAFGEDGTAVIG
jgi:hypothetical protein